MELGEILSDIKNKKYAIGIMAETILNEDLTSNEAINRNLWLIRWPEAKEGKIDKYFGDFPQNIKEEAIKLAEEKKKK